MTALPEASVPDASAATTAGPPAPRLYIVLTRVPRRTALAVGSLGDGDLGARLVRVRRAAPRGRAARASPATSPARSRSAGTPTTSSRRSRPSAPGWSTAPHGECELAGALAALPGAERLPRRFGAGDCRCAGHLVRFARRPLRRDLAAAAHAAGAPPNGAVRAFGRRPPPPDSSRPAVCAVFPPYLGV